MLFRSLSCLGWPCSDFIYHAVVSGVREQPGGGTQCPRIPSSDCPGYAVTERNQQSDTRVSPKAPRNSRHGLRPRIITERISSDRSCAPTCIRTRPMDTSSTWYIPALSPPREAHRDATDSTSGRRPETMLDRLPPSRPLAPLPPRSGREPGQASPTTPDSDSDGSVCPHPGASSFRPSPTVVHGPRELLQDFTIALRNAHLEPFTAWTQGELDEMVRRKKDKDSRPTYKTIARFLQKPTEEVKQAWKVYQQLEARA